MPAASSSAASARPSCSHSAGTAHARAAAASPHAAPFASAPVVVVRAPPRSEAPAARRCCALPAPACAAPEPPPLPPASESPPFTPIHASDPLQRPSVRLSARIICGFLPDRPRRRDHSRARRRWRAESSLSTRAAMWMRARLRAFACVRVCEEDDCGSWKEAATTPSSAATPHCHSPACGRSRRLRHPRAPACRPPACPAHGVARRPLAPQCNALFFLRFGC